jgi:cytochrome c biogenesis protein CcmG/thiol:disulfide interchange protein DsbE
MKVTSIRIYLTRASALFLTLAGIAMAADQPGVRAVLQPAKERKPAPEFALQDSSGKTTRLRSYRGKVLLLDFWATWCTGCKKEIPWFSELQRTYGAKRLAVVGVSLDEGGWKVVKPFLADTRVPYRILLGNNATAQQYAITNLPDTFLIDQQGKPFRFDSRRLTSCKADGELQLRVCGTLQDGFQHTWKHKWKFTLGAHASTAQK